jgi:hypothetical protein
MASYLSSVVNHLIIESPSRAYVRKLDEALLYLSGQAFLARSKLPTLKKIIIQKKPGYRNQLFPYKRIWVSESSVINKNSVVYLASLLLHEIHHLMQYDRGVRNIQGRAERGAYHAQYKFLVEQGHRRDAEGIMRHYRELKQKGSREIK